MQERKQIHINLVVGLIFAVFFSGVIIGVGGPPVMAGVAGVVAFVAGAAQ